MATVCHPASGRVTASFAAGPLSGRVSSSVRVFAVRAFEVGASRNGIACMLREGLGAGEAGQVEFKVLCTPLSYYGVPIPITRIIAAARKHDVRVNVWTVNETDVAQRLWLAGVTGIISDDPASMIALRKQLEAHGF